MRPEKSQRLATVLYHLADSIVTGASLLESFMPKTACKIVEQFGSKIRTLEETKISGGYPSGSKVTNQPEILFARLDVKEVMEKVDAMFTDKNEAAAIPAVEEEVKIDIEKKAEIEYDDFSKMQFQIGEIIACEEVKKSKKLLCSQVRIGSQVKQIVSGIKAYYSAEEMVGKKVMVLVNLKPATLAGVLSEGMLLCAENADGSLALMVPEKEMPSGAEIS
ncbi:MAG: methionine--tRNA ligase subunit beta [Clostridiales bacterium]|nr:methionine--tRNA ligase subunit beta [Clostridiales bacterium]